MIAAIRTVDVMRNGTEFFSADSPLSTTIRVPAMMYFKRIIPPDVTTTMALRA